MNPSDELLGAALELEKPGVEVAKCPKCGVLAFSVTEVRSDNDPDFLLGKSYLCSNCGASADSRIGKRVPTTR